MAGARKTSAAPTVVTAPAPLRTSSAAGTRMKDFRSDVLPRGAPLVVGGDHAGRTANVQSWFDESCRVDNLIGPVKGVLGGVVMEGSCHDVGRGFGRVCG